MAGQRAMELEPAEFLTGGIRAEAAGDCGVAARQEIERVSLSGPARHHVIRSLIPMRGVRDSRGIERSRYRGRSLEVVRVASCLRG